MFIRALKSTTGLPRGCVGEVDDYTAKEMIALGYAIEELPVEMQAAAPAPANDNEVQPDGPLAAAVPQIGGQTGEEAQQLSSQVGRQRRKRRSN